MKKSKENKKNLCFFYILVYNKNMKNEQLVKKDVKNKKWNIYNIFGLLGDILFIPIILISLISCYVMYADRQANKVPSLFGLSLVSITTTSMERGGYKVGDIVFATKADPKKLEAGDIITYYYYLDGTVDKEKKPENLTLLQSYDRTLSPDEDYNHGTKTQYQRDVYQQIVDNSQTQTERRAVKNLSSTTKIYFHRIVAVYSDDEGTLFFQTQGDTNADPDRFLIAEDYVVAKYLNTPGFIRGIFTFMASTIGIILLIIVPLSILALFLLFSIIEQVSRIFLEKKLLNRDLRYDDVEVVESNICMDLDKLDKLNYFATSLPTERKEVSEYMWGFLSDGNTKERYEYQMIKKLVRTYDKEPQNFWDYWIETSNSSRERTKIKNMKQKFVEVKADDEAADSE